MRDTHKDCCGLRTRLAEIDYEKAQLRKTRGSNCYEHAKLLRDEELAIMKLLDEEFGEPKAECLPNVKLKVVSPEDVGIIAYGDEEVRYNRHYHVIKKINDAIVPKFPDGDAALTSVVVSFEPFMAEAVKNCMPLFKDAGWQASYSQASPEAAVWVTITL